MKGRRGAVAVPVHGHGDGALVILPCGVQVGAGQVGGVEPPGGLQGDGGRVNREGGAGHSDHAGSQAVPTPTGLRVPW